MQNQPLNDAEFDVIENTLLQYGDDHSVLNPSELDGYLAALVSSPAPQAALLQAIIDCAEQDNFELPADLDLDQHRQQVAAIEPAARALHQYWLEQR